jgi:hypothetical protein
MLFVDGVGIVTYRDGLFSSIGGPLETGTGIPPVAWRPDSKKIYSASSGNTLLTSWRLPDVLREHRIICRLGGFTAISHHPTRDLFTTAQYDATMIHWNGASMTPYSRIILLPNAPPVTITAAGQILHGDRKVVDEHLVYYYETDGGRIETVTPSEFEKLIGQSIYVPEPPEPLVGMDTEKESSGEASDAAPIRKPLDDAERQQLRTVLRDLIGIDVSRVTLLGDLRQLSKNPTADDWSKIQKRASANRERLVPGINRLETLESEFIVDEMTAFRQLLIDLDNKKRIYDGIIKMESSKAIAAPTRINRIADAYESLIESLRKHEQAIQKYLQR